MDFFIEFFLVKKNFKHRKWPPSSVPNFLARFLDDFNFFFNFRQKKFSKKKKKNLVKKIFFCRKKSVFTKMNIFYEIFWWENSSKTFENDIFINKIVFKIFGPLAGSLDSRCLRHRGFAKTFLRRNSPYKIKIENNCF